MTASSKNAEEGMTASSKNLKEGMLGFMSKEGAGKDLLKNVGSNGPLVSFIHIGPWGAGKRKKEEERVLKHIFRHHSLFVFPAPLGSPTFTKVTEGLLPTFFSRSLPAPP